MEDSVFGENDILADVLRDQTENSTLGSAVLTEESPPDVEPYESLDPIPVEGSLHIELKKFVIESLCYKASSVVPSKDIMPVLKNFQFEALPGRLRVVATDLELSVISTTEMVLTKTSGIAVFPAKRMIEIIREADEGDIVIDVDKGVATITAGRASWNLKLQDGSDYPPMPEISDIDLHAVNRVKFLGAIRAVRYAAAQDTTRPSLMMIDVTNGKMTACDGVRFQQATLGDDFPLSLQIPTGAIEDLVKLLNTTDHTDIGIGESDFHLVFKVGSDVFIANKLMAQFPDVEQILLRPALENKDKLLVDRQEFVEALKRVRITADPETSAIGLKLDNGTLSVTSKDKYGNGAEESIDASWDKGERLLVVNHKFLMDMLQMYDGKSCQFLLGTDTKSRKSPVMLRDDETGTVGVIQQMLADLVGY